MRIPTQFGWRYELPQKTIRGYVGDISKIFGKLSYPRSTLWHHYVPLQLSTEDDLFFNYFHTLDGSGFDHMKNRQKLMIQFQSYPMVLMSTLNKCIKQPHTYMCVLYISENGTGRLDFIQNMEYKFVDLLSVRFTKSTEEFIRQQVSYRYKMMKKQVSMLQHKLEEVNKMIKLRNPSLLLQVGKILPKPIINDWESR